jgi:hypothetical protein
MHSMPKKVWEHEVTLGRPQGQSDFRDGTISNKIASLEWIAHSPNVYGMSFHISPFPLPTSFNNHQSSYRHSNNPEQTQLALFKCDHRGTFSSFIRTSSKYSNKAHHGPHNPYWARMIIETSSNNFEQASTGFRTILSNSAAAFLIAYICTYPPQCPRSYDMHIG